MSAQPQAAPAGATWSGRLRRPRVLGAILVVALAGLHHFADTPLQAWLRNAWFDAYQIMMPRERVSAPAVVVAVDEKSLAQLGQWPWPRTLVARVLDRLAEHGPLAVGVDVIFSEPDRLSPGAIAEYNPQRRLLNDIMRELPDGRGRGTFFWEPTQSGAWGPAMFTWQGNRASANAADFAEYDQMKIDFGL